MTRPGPRRILPAVRFLEKVAAFGSSELDCWEWGAKRNNRGFGVFWDGHRGVLAHRFSYEMWIGPIPAGLLLDHLCGNPACVRPDHLEPVTRGNEPPGPAADAARGQPAAQTHCAHGHLLPEERSRAGKRRCRPCASRRSAQYRARRRG